MLNIGAGEIGLIMVVALLLLGPKRLPELARGVGKFLREFRRQTDEVRSTLETEFYRMDQDILRDAPSSPPSAPVPVSAALPGGGHSGPVPAPPDGAALDAPDPVGPYGDGSGDCSGDDEVVAAALSTDHAPAAEPEGALVEASPGDRAR